MYQGRTVTASNHTTDHKKKNVTLKSLGIGNKSVAELNAKSTCTCMYLFCIQLNVHEAASLYQWQQLKLYSVLCYEPLLSGQTPLNGHLPVPEVSRFMKVLPNHLYLMILMDLQEEERYCYQVSSKYTTYILTDTDTLQTPCSVSFSSATCTEKIYIHFNNKQTVANNWL